MFNCNYIKCSFDLWLAVRGIDNKRVMNEKIFSFDGRGGIMNILLVLLIGVGVKSSELLQPIFCSV